MLGKTSKMFTRMTKCDFCTKSAPNGKCFYTSQVAREDDCKVAINRMMKVLGKNTEVGKDK